MELWFIFAAGGVFFAGLFVYLAFMIFLPEWVGITGKSALEAERSHTEGEKPTEGELLNRMQARSNEKPPVSKT